MHLITGIKPSLAVIRFLLDLKNFISTFTSYSAQIESKVQINSPIPKIFPRKERIGQQHVALIYQQEMQLLIL